VPAVRSKARDVSVPGGLPRVPSRRPAVLSGSLVVHATSPSPKTTTPKRITVRFMSASPGQDAPHASVWRMSVTSWYGLGCGSHTNFGCAPSSAPCPPTASPRLAAAPHRLRPILVSRLVALAAGMPRAAPIAAALVPGRLWQVPGRGRRHRGEPRSRHAVAGRPGP